MSQRERQLVRLRQDHWKLLLFNNRRRAYINNALEQLLCRNAHQRLSGAGKTYIRWINYVLGTQYTNQRATQLWEIGKLLQLDDAYWVRCNPDLGYLLEDYPPECADRDQTLSYLAAYHFDELCSILPPLTDEDWEELKQSKMLTIQAIYD